ncbi:MAG: DsbC family protein [Burkholderiaceae bacterium]|jgi:thiol:disulfide interchange protein DsbC|nr:DsbC family protein [Burkholderiaceae bacterium]
MKRRSLALAALALALPLWATAQEAVLRKNLAERMGMQQIDEVRSAPISGLYEVRIGNDIYYSDAQGNYVLNGSLLDTRNKRNLTSERLEKLMAIQFDDLELKNAFQIVRGNGKRKVAIFEDPNCGYCKRLEQDLQKIDNLTVHIFLVPILGADSAQKSQQIWCAANQAATWSDWMLRGVVPQNKAICDTSPLQANLAFIQKYRITGTPALIFADGTRVPGAIGVEEIERLLNR